MLFVSASTFLISLVFFCVVVDVTVSAEAMLEGKIEVLEGKLAKAEKVVEQLEDNKVEGEGKARDEWREDLTAARKEKEQLRELLLIEKKERQAPQGVC